VNVEIVEVVERDSTQWESTQRRDVSFGFGWLQRLTMAGSPSSSGDSRDDGRHTEATASDKVKFSPQADEGKGRAIQSSRVKRQGSVAVLECNGDSKALIPNGNNGESV
jgi:hypothetical protein